MMNPHFVPPTTSQHFRCGRGTGAGGTERGSIDRDLLPTGNQEREPTAGPTACHLGPQ